MRFYQKRKFKKSDTSKRCQNGSKDIIQEVMNNFVKIGFTRVFLTTKISKEIDSDRTLVFRKDISYILHYIV